MLDFPVHGLQRNVLHHSWFVGTVGRLPCGNAWCHIIRSPALPARGLEPRHVYFLFLDPNVQANAESIQQYGVENPAPG